VQLLVDPVQVFKELRVLVPAAVDPEEVLGPVRLCLEQIVEVEAELLSKLADRHMPLVDELSPVLADER